MVTPTRLAVACLAAANSNTEPLSELTFTAPEVLATAPALLARTAAWINETTSPNGIERLAQSADAGYEPDEIKSLWMRLLTGTPLPAAESIAACLVAADLAGRTILAAEGTNAENVLSALAEVAATDLREALA